VSSGESDDKSSIDRFFDAHVLSSQVPRTCYGLAAVTLDGAYAAFLSAVSFRCMNV
jgi:hypothetical protein